jgi:UDP-N-acetylbacillosamine N-acetyltransferase
MKVIVFGTSDFAKQIGFYISQSKQYELAYFCVNKNFYVDTEFMGKKILIFEDDLVNLSNTEFKFIVAVGYKHMRNRKKIFEMIKSKGYCLINYIHSTVTMMGEIKGEGNIILANTTLEPFSEVYDNNIIWSNSLLCHDSIVGSHNFIAASSIIGGFSKVLENNFIGLNSVVKENVVVNKEVLIGAKSLVLKSPEDYSVYYGIPAVKIKEHKETGIELQAVN